MNSATQLSSTATRHCIGGVTTAGGTADNAQNKPGSRRDNSIDDATGNDGKRKAGCSILKRHNVDEETGPARETRWYSAMIRGALGRWNRIRMGRSPGRKVARMRPQLSSESISHESTNVTNNNCKKGDRCNMHENSPCRNQRIVRTKSETTGPTNDDRSMQNLRGHKPWDVACAEGDTVDGRNSRVADGHLTAGTPNGRSTETSPAGATLLNTGCGQIEREQRPKSDGGCRQVLIKPPDRDGKIETKDLTTVENGDCKHKRGKRKYFHSPSRKKENDQGGQKVQSTYVSFQDDFADDMYTNAESFSGILSAAAARADIQRSHSTTESFSRISPSSLADDVFADCCQRPESHESNGLGTSSDELENDRIARLFRRVSTAFEESIPDAKNIPMSKTPLSEHVSKTQPQAVVEKVSKLPDANTAFEESQKERMETIMITANLQASLDNALCMLNQSTKLLGPNDSNRWSQEALNGARHQPHTMGCFQPSRPRTYSTCSRLEPIAEENDRNDETPSGPNLVDVVDTVSCTFSESSEYEKFNFSTSRANLYFTRDETSQKYPDCTASSAGRTYFGDQRAVTSQKNLDPKLQWLINAGGTTPRSNSISTISVQSLHKEKDFTKDLSPLTSAEKCAACEWTCRIHPRAMVSVIPNSAWKRIVNDSNSCHNYTHFHPWGMCTDNHKPPVLCHSHYLQYYQYLQNDHKLYKGRRHLACTPATAQPDSIIDYDIHKVLRDLDDLPITVVDGSYGHLHRIKQSDTDMSVNSDSAFSTNGSPTPSTRDGANTDGEESVGSINDRLESEKKFRNGKEVLQFSHYNPMHVCSLQDPWLHSNENTSREKRTQSYDDARSNKDMAKCSAGLHKQRYSLVSSLCSSSHPLTPYALGDSAVHLQDCASSQSTHLSSESFFDSETFFGNRETCLIKGTSQIEALSKSSSEESLLSEGTLCLSEFAMSQQNIAILPASSFPRISELCSPTKSFMIKDTVPIKQTEAQLQEWVEKAKITESMLESFLNSSLAQLQPNSMSAEESTSVVCTHRPSSHTDTLASSSGSSDTNTLGSGSSGSAYTTSSLRSYSRFNTLDSSSCVSTDDTGETVIDQYMLRSNGRRQNTGETQFTPKQHKMKKKASELNKMRYQSSTFHYKNLEAPCLSQSLHKTDIITTTITKAKDAIEVEVSNPIKTYFTEARPRSSSTSCILTSLTKTICVIQQSKSLPCVYLSIDKRSAQAHVSSKKHQEADKLFLKPLSPSCGQVLQNQVHTMMQNYSDIDNIIASLRESLKSSKTRETENFLDQKVLELGNILKQKDKMIKQLHCMLLACAMPEKRIGQSHQLSATM